MRKSRGKPLRQGQCTGHCGSERTYIDFPRDGSVYAAGCTSFALNKIFARKAVNANLTKINFFRALGKRKRNRIYFVYQTTLIGNGYVLVTCQVLFSLDWVQSVHSITKTQLVGHTEILNFPHLVVISSLSEIEL